MLKPLLSICIPTYCRAHYLSDCLAAITLQLEHNPDLLEKIEIVVSDNASTDNTKDIIDLYQKKYKNIRYFRNSENIGIDRNYINVVEKSKGRYGWLIGDDDFIVNGGIDFVVNFLNKNTVSLLTVDSKPFNKDDNVSERKNDINGSMLSSFTSHDKFFQKGYCVGILCTTIFDRDLWLSMDRSDYGYGWSYYEIALKMMVKSSLPMVHLSYPLMVVRQDCAWVENGAELSTFINSNNVTEKMIGFGYDKTRLTRELIENNKRILIILLRAKGHGLKCDIKNLRFIYKNLRKAGIVRLFFTTLIYFIPNKMIVVIRDLKKYILKSIR